ncbi:MAG: biotin--[acetyl-CoA-carboxylase] ligase [Ruminococcaceae bacterium]|nr:biotin--[acetyl-CoA-carboxylase] ligase [Oscillospiraceae bacterium]
MYDIISKEKINSLICDASYNIIVLETVSSTNLYLKELSKDGAPHETVVIADNQTNGRGRPGREFFSPSGTGIYMSILIHPDKTELQPGLLTVAAGVAVCRALESVCSTIPRIKWVNDIFVNGKKVCGVLAESLTNPLQGINSIIVGIGINVTTSSADFPGELSNIAGSVFPENATRNEIIAKVLAEFKMIYNSFDAKSLIEEYKSYLFVLGKKISFNQNGKTFSGIASDINTEGNLIVKLENGETITLKSGEVSLGSENFTE